MLITRRTLLLGAAASTLAACSAKTGLSGPADKPATANTRSPSGGGKSAGSNSGKNSNVPASVTMVGDSITVLSKDALQLVLADLGILTITINGEKSRRIEVGYKKPLPGVDVVKFIAHSGPSPDMWILALGTNDAGLYSTDSEYQGLIDDMLTAIPDHAPLVWMNVYRNDQLAGCEQFNALLRTTLMKRGNATVGEWFQQVTKTKESILSHDGVHPNANGVLVFADTIRTAVVAQMS